MTDHVIHDQLRTARPTPITEIPATLRHRVLDAHRAEPPALPAAPVRRRWASRGLPLAIAGVVGIGGVAAATGLVVSTATKQQASALRHQPPGSSLGGPGVRGASLRRELERIRAVTPFPPGVHDTFPVARLEGVAIGSVRATVEERAACYWQRFWVSSTENSDARGATDALKVLHQIAYWPSNTARYQGNSRVSAVRVAHQAEIGDTAAFKARMAVNCQGVFPTPLP